MIAFIFYIYHLSEKIGNFQKEFTFNILEQANKERSQFIELSKDVI